MATEPKTVAAKKIANLREHILNKSDLEEELVHVPGWDCDLLVRALTGAQRAKFQKQLVARTPGATPSGEVLSINWERMWADLVIVSAHDPEDGSLIFAPTDRDALLAKAALNLEAVASVARRLSGLDDNALANAKSESEDD